MTSRCKVLAAVLATLAGASQAQVPGNPGVATPPSTRAAVVTTTTTTASSAAMQRLDATAQELRQAIGLLARKPPGAERDVALAEAQKALLKTQQAMIDLPPEYRIITTARAPQGYDPSAKELMAAADSLRDSIHVMAREPASERRNQAIRDANRALLDMQASMANAYDATAFAPQTTTLGAGPAMQCVWLGTMWGCN